MQAKPSNHKKKQADKHTSTNKTKQNKTKQNKTKQKTTHSEAKHIHAYIHTYTITLQTNSECELLKKTNENEKDTKPKHNSISGAVGIYYTSKRAARYWHSIYCVLLY